MWTKKEIDDLLGKNAPVFDAYYGITDAGNWEHGNNVLHQHESIDEVAKTLQNIVLLFEQCHPPMAEKYLQSILQIKEHIYLKESAEVAKAHDMLGDHYRFSMDSG